MRQLKIDLSELEMAFDNHSYELSYFLDLETGNVLFITDEIRSMYKSIYKSYYDEQAQSINWENAFEQEHISDWLRDALLDAERIEAGFGSRFISIPPEESHEGYRDMEAFIDTVPSQYLQEHLERAISGRGAFRRFKDVLLDFPAERERWFKIKRERQHLRILDWLEAFGITLLQ